MHFLRRQDLHDVAVLKLIGQRDHAAIDLGAVHPVADAAVDAVSEIDRHRSGRQRAHITLGCEDKDLVGDQAAFKRFHELAGVAHILLPVQQLAQPGQLAVVRLAALALRQAFLVAPVRGDAVFGGPVHRLSADLDLKRDAARTDHSRVQRLVHVGLGHRDVVLETARHRLVQLVNQSEDRVAVGNSRHNHPGREQIVNLVQALFLFLHLAVDAVKMLGPAFDFCRDAHLANLDLHLDHDFLEILLALRPLLGDGADQFVVGVAVDVAQAQVLQLPLDLVDAEPVRQRGIDVQRLTGFIRLLFRRHMPHCAHVVQPVSQLDQNHADIPGHGQEHFAEILRLDLLFRRIGDPAQLGDAVDQFSHVVPEGLTNFVDGLAGVFDRVMEQRGNQRILVHLKVGQNRRHSQRVDDIRFPGRPLLGAVRVDRIGIGPRDLVAALAAGVLMETFQNLVEHVLPHDGRRLAHLTTPPSRSAARRR